MQPRNNKPIIWIDMEMSGLDAKRDSILEISCIITSSDLSIVILGPTLVIRCSRFILGSMNDWCREHHTRTGLFDKCLKSGISLDQADRLIVDFLAQHNVPFGVCCIAGNGIANDREFIKQQMSRLNGYLSPRGIIEVNTLKEICKLLYPQIYKARPQKKYLHTSEADVRESIEEYRYYIRHIFK